MTKTSALCVPQFFRCCSEVTAGTRPRYCLISLPYTDLAGQMDHFGDSFERHIVPAGVLRSFSADILGFWPFATAMAAQLAPCPPPETPLDPLGLAAFGAKTAEGVAPMIVVADPIFWAHFSTLNEGAATLHLTGFLQDTSGGAIELMLGMLLVVGNDALRIGMHCVWKTQTRPVRKLGPTICIDYFPGVAPAEVTFDDKHKHEASKILQGSLLGEAVRIKYDMARAAVERPGLLPQFVSDPAGIV